MEVTYTQGVEKPPTSYAWVAGIIEGEGSLTLEPVKGRKNSKRYSIAVTMTDKDIVEELYRILQVGTIRGPYNYGNKPLWTWAIQNQQGCFEVLLRIMPYLGRRRLEKAHSMFESLEEKVDKWL